LKASCWKMARHFGGRSPKPAVCASPSGRDPESTLLHQVVRGQLSSFLDEAADRGGLPPFVGLDFTRYLACGVLAHGFARLACRLHDNDVLGLQRLCSYGARLVLPWTI